MATYKIELTEAEAGFILACTANTGARGSEAMRSIISLEDKLLAAGVPPTPKPQNASAQPPVQLVESESVVSAGGKNGRHSKQNQKARM